MPADEQLVYPALSSHVIVKLAEEPILILAVELIPAPQLQVEGLTFVTEVIWQAALQPLVTLTGVRISR